jgi:hypothetical protein
VNTTNGNNPIYKDKEKKLFTHSPIHGTPGWEEENGEFKEMIYWDREGISKWMTGDEYRLHKKEVKRKRVQYYINHPSELTKKIEGKMKFKIRTGLLGGDRYDFGITW